MIQFLVPKSSHVWKKVWHEGYGLKQVPLILPMVKTFWMCHRIAYLFASLKFRAESTWDFMVLAFSRCDPITSESIINSMLWGNCVSWNQPLQIQLHVCRTKYIKTQYVQISCLIDTSIYHPIWGHYNPMVKGCMDICLIW